MDQRYACADPLPPPGSPSQHEQMAGFFQSRVLSRYRLDALTHLANGNWAGPGDLCIGGAYVTWLRGLPSASALHLGVSAEPFDPVQIFDGTERIGMLMRIHTLPPYGPELLDRARSGEVVCIMHLAHLHITGSNGAPLDSEKALYWLSRAAEQNVPDAFYLMGGAFFHGLGTEPDPVKSLLLLERAISLGCCAAMSLRMEVIQAMGAERYRSAAVHVARELGLQPV